MKKVLILGASLALPGNGAATIHAIRLAQTLQLAGFQPIVLIPRSHGRPEDLQPDGTFQADGVSYVPVGDATGRTNPLGRCGVFLGVGSPFLRYLQPQSHLPLAIICSSTSFGLLARLNAFCRSRRIVLISECTEWFAYSHMWREGAVYLMDMELRMRFLHKRVGLMIVNCSFLDHYYAAQGCRVFRLPPVLDTNDIRWMPSKRDRTSSTLTLLFSGSPGRDRQGIILRSVRRLRSEGLNVSIEYVGSTVDQVRQSLGKEAAVLDDLGGAVVCHGNVRYEDLPNLLSRASYTVLLRDDVRWSRACFPSKVPECLSLGIPLICNRTSDLAEYLCDGREALLTDSVTEEAFAESLRRAVAGGVELRERMSKCARERAQKCFDMRNYAFHLGEFIRTSCIEPRGAFG